MMEEAEDSAARRIQLCWRKASAIGKLLRAARRAWEIGFDEESGDYFYYNKQTAKSTWERPAVFAASDAVPYRTDPGAKRAAVRLQSLFRRHLAARRAASTPLYQKEYDPDSGGFYYLNKKTMQAQWEAPVSEAKMGVDSELILARDKEIAELRNQLREKDEQIEKVKDQRLNELGRQIRVKRVAAALKGARRSKNFEDWRNEHVIAWFIDMGLGEHVKALEESRVDGLLMLNMDEEDLVELGITKRLDQRKIEVALRKYRRRYEQQRGGGHYDDEDDEDLGEEEGVSSDEDEENDSDEDEEKKEEQLRQSLAIVDDDDPLPTEEELLELERDRANVKIDVVYPGDEQTYPEIGDIIRCHCVCRIVETGVEIENTRMKKKPLEFVLGTGQVVQGVDRGLVQMSFGERSKLTVSSEYAYGAKGVEPLIPPHATLIFDLELLRWRHRIPWIKPLIQRPGLTQHPHEEEHGEKEEEESVFSPVSRRSSVDDTKSLSTISENPE